MKKHFIATFLCAGLGLIDTSGFARADSIGRYECSVVGAVAMDAIGDREGHVPRTVQFNCVGVDGLLKGGVYTAISIAEWTGSEGRYLLGDGVHRTAGGLAVAHTLEGIGSFTMRDGKPAGVTSSGRAIFSFASGTLASLAGRAIKFVSKTTGTNQFEMEITD
jgi:hypothetical protein